MISHSSAAHERYLFKPFPGSSHSWALGLLSSETSASAILDIGAGNGDIGRELKQKNFANIYAIEVDQKSKEHISSFYKEIASDMDTVSQRKFDIILLLDVLEHVNNPAKFLEVAVSMLNPGGKILISLPNVAHWSVRIPLLFGKFNYKERGILDKTHLTFFTRNTALKFLNSAKGISLLSTSASIEPLELILPQAVCNNALFGLLSKLRIKIANLLPGIFAYQNLFVLQKQ
jgi:2-polyprenyl-3-methyl-5-hydroxy-6-metoxy-1,4-benzoquinol methylase